VTIKLTLHEENDVTTVEISGKLTLGEATNTLRTTIRELVEDGFRRILLNMAEVPYIDSSGVGELIGAYTNVTNAGGEMKLLNLARHTHDLLKITKLYTIFETFEDEATAIRSFSAIEPTAMQAHS
jgi:anti-sigma B factor antagonist